MRKLLLLGLLIALWPMSAKANVPLVVSRCSASANNLGTSATLACALTNTTSGNTIIVEIYGLATGVTYTTTESLTCPAGATVQHTYTAPGRLQICYVVQGSSHAIFSVSALFTGGSTQGNTLIVKEMQGLGAVDSGSASATFASSVSVTTANSTEWLESFCGDYNNDFSPGTGFTQGESSALTDPGVQGYRGFSEKQITTTAGSYTAACTPTNSFPVILIAALAFQESSPPVTPSVNIVQACFANGVNIPGVGAGMSKCTLHSTASGNKIVVGAVYGTNSATSNIVDAVSTEALTCPLNSQATRLDTANFVTGVCYVDTASSHSTFTVSIALSGAGSFGTAMFAYEVTGVSSGIDAGSEAAATATSVSYTTAAANEWTILVGADTTSSNMTPGGSFLQWGGTTTPASAHMQQQLAAAVTTVSSGSNTASFAVTGSTKPLISTASFGTPAPLSKGFPYVAKVEKNDEFRDSQ